MWSIKTEDEVVQVLSLIDTLINSLYKMGEESFEQVVTYLPQTGIVGRVVDGVKVAGSGGERQGWLEGLKSEVKKMQGVQLTTAIDIDGQFLGELKKIGGEKVFINIKVDPGILGGAAIAFGGRYSEATLAAKIDQALKEMKI
ncbi:hypothetical protein A2989_01825 [Candidatus Amesbacteria bacterium RIFCSPLOWO2_01_FULL_48_25]|uniref:Uncharacterized protein n=1 Tax=Candidatus Amesbacteria bacterium RIFCSPLOWO2_01_FULL_48_25 TaxID=1797259 RepID=A0A1F4ZF02_9BACT|nr:MAG: hypothetical protein A2989_01825 [Candidatus Amesbacteria bacterium RIFCSPLOWO2_01_FULL_48_25]